MRDQSLEAPSLQQAGHETERASRKLMGFNFV
jgi:hypothetical protein